MTKQAEDLIAEIQQTHFTFLSWEAFTLSCADNLDAIEDLSQFAIYTWREAIRRTKAKHIHALQTGHIYTESNCALCTIAYAYYKHDAQTSCTVCPWQLIFPNHIRDDNPIIGAIAPCVNLILTINNNKHPISDSPASITRLNIWDELLTARLTESLAVQELFEEQLESEGIWKTI